MKNYLLYSIFIFTSGPLLSQSARQVLLENFTHASSQESFLAAPGLLDLQVKNESNVISLQYHPSQPGTDPFYSANPAEMQARANFYNVNSVPAVCLDGTIFSGLPDNLPQSAIDSRSSQTAPFDINIQHQLSITGDTIFVSMVVIATQAFIGNLSAFVAVTEKNVYFTTPPGSTPRKKFENVMRKMLPDESGSVIQSIWSPGDSVVIAESWPLTGIYNTTQLAVVGWVQDFVTKEVIQAGYSRNHMALDIGVVATDFPPVLCPGNFLPRVIVKNLGTDVLTSCTVGSKINGGGVTTKAWTGTIFSLDTGIIRLDTVNALPGSYVLATAATIPNFGIDEDPDNDSNYFSYTVIDTILTPPYSEGFEGPVFPPVHWAIANPENDITWEMASTGAFGSSLQSAQLACFTATRNRMDALYLPAMDMSGISATGDPFLRFDYAYTFLDDSAGNRYDTLFIEASTDCGFTWTILRQEGGAGLATLPGTNSGFAPGSGDWKNDSCSLLSLIQQPQVLIRFRVKSGRGNNFYLDNVNVDITTGIESPDGESGFSIAPVPSDGEVTLLNRKQERITGIKIADRTGKMVYHKLVDAAPEEKQVLNLNFLPQGIYFAIITSVNRTETIKLVILH